MPLVLRLVSLIEKKNIVLLINTEASKENDQVNDKILTR